MSSSLSPVCFHPYALPSGPLLPTHGIGSKSLSKGEHLCLDGWFNLLNLASWEQSARLGAVRLKLVGQGRVRLTLWHKVGADEPYSLGVYDLSLPADVPVSTLPQNGVIWPDIKACENSQIDEIGWWTDTRQAPIRLAIVITTFRRETGVTMAAERLASALANHISADQAHIFLIDNGQTLVLPDHPRWTVVPNRNLGGSGGFARGMAEATDRGFTHCLFMDDDAATTDEAVLRTVAYLRLAKSPKVAVAGAMISEVPKNQMWEYGARFDGMCRPISHGVDLADQPSALVMEQALKPEKLLYGGWWFFAFPLAAVTHWPFPFFVRGDDSSFSLANRFDIARLAGVASVQEGFDRKSSPLTRYLDMRYHLHHLMVFPHLTPRHLRRWRSVQTALRLIARNIATMHYDSAAAELIAWRDMMRGPEFFAADPTASERRAEIANLTLQEEWHPDATPLSEDVVPVPSRLENRLIKLSLNGHLIPFWQQIAPARTISIAQRGRTAAYWGASRVQVQDIGGGRMMDLGHSKRRAFGLGVRAVGLTVAWLVRYPHLQRRHRAGYLTLATRAFWDKEFSRRDAT